ncbi:unnamed protein product [Mucor hiemalis]
MWYSKDYDPIQVGSIDGTDIDPHDAAVIRATRSNYRPPKYLKTDPKCTLFISRLNFDSTETTIKLYFEKYGPISNIELVRNNVTGLSQGYAFVTFVDEKSTQEAYKYAHETTLDSHIILVDYERSRVMKGWIPRRFGGGFGGKRRVTMIRGDLMLGNIRTVKDQIGLAAVVDHQVEVETTSEKDPQAEIETINEKDLQAETETTEEKDLLAEIKTTDEKDLLAEIKNTDEKDLQTEIIDMKITAAVNITIKEEMIVKTILDPHIKNPEANQRQPLVATTINTQRHIK